MGEVIGFDKYWAELCQTLDDEPPREVKQIVKMGWDAGRLPLEYALRRIRREGCSDPQCHAAVIAEEALVTGA